MYLFSDEDYRTCSPVPVIFEAGSFSSTVRILIVDDRTAERPERFRAVLNGTSPEVIIPAGEGEATVNIFDTDGKSRF